MKLLHGNNLDLLRAMPDNSVHAIVCDPPYGLGKEPDALAMLRDWIETGHHDVKSKSGFMGKTWDNFVPQPVQWRECYRVLKPGGHLLSFAGTRTQDLVALGIRLAGFEIRDLVAWVYGCLSEDTEILIDGEWCCYHKAIAGRHALCYDIHHDTYSWQPIEAQFLYNYEGEAFRIHSGQTDQVVSRNHRCIVDRGRGWEFITAEEAARQSEICVPILQDVSVLRDAFRCSQSLSGSAEQDMLAGVQRGDAEKAASTSPDGTAQDGNGEVCDVWQESLEAERMDQENQGVVLLQPVQRGGTRQGVGEARAQGASGMDGRKHEVLLEEDDRREQPRMEGRRDSQESERKLQWSALCALPEGVSSDGAEGRLCYGASPCRGSSPRADAVENGSGASHQPQAGGQPHRELGTVSQQPSAQAIRGEGHTVADVARIEPIFGINKVWCVKVPTGAFVARRKGKVFVTGNSGFPKSLDVSKALDKMAGAEREVVGENPNHRPVSGVGYEGVYAGGNTGAATITAPATEAAKQWDGWGTALKPALEPITLARKPLEGTVAANVLKWHTGALNVDGCRVGAFQNTTPSGVDRRNAALAEAGYRPGEYQMGAKIPDTPAGRWPSNLVHDGSDEVTGLFPVTKSGGGDKASISASENRSMSGKNYPRERGHISVPDSGSAARFFYAAKVSAKERNEGLEHLPDHDWQGDGAAVPERENRPFNPSKNHHPTVKPIALMRYLCRLITPPGGTVLDPWMGSGSTGKAAALEGFDFIGMEQDADYFAIAQARCGVKAETFDEEGFWG